MNGDAKTFPNPKRRRNRKNETANVNKNVGGEANNTSDGKEDV
jgi:hypothetical protein